MNDDRWQRVKTIFDEAVACPVQDRQAFVADACDRDADLQAEVQSLLSSHDSADSVMASPTHPLHGTPTPAAANEEPGTIIGRYKLLELIGEGGFGAVYMAEQTEPVRRKVALKIIKLGMDTKQVIARFEAERQALAMMDHPNIAKVLDVGTTETGRPYFVMELVKGVPITEYCDTEKLPTSDRLTLMTRVCHAVQHAHQKGVIHRDIKPSNVMVTITDGRPIPKVIDFGIAKATGRALTDKTLFTEYRQLIGTPAYMSPEQAEMSGGDIDTRSDIYSLGVLLYELLTGTTPFDPQRLRSAQVGELQRIIREEDPDKPSTRISSLRSAPRDEGSGAGTIPDEPQARAPGDPSSAFSLPVPRSGFHDSSSAITISKHRRTDPHSLSRRLRGDLDWIVMKCLEKDRARRYETANGVAMDIQRHLENQPVEAGPPTAAYRVRKFVRRNRAMVTAATMVVAALLAGTAGTTFGLLRAEKREKETQQVADFQASQLSEINAQTMGVRLRRALIDAAPEDRRSEVEQSLAGLNFTSIALGTLQDNIFDGTLGAIDTQFEDQPLVQAQLLQTMAVTLRDLGLLDLATGPQERALAIRRNELGEEHPNTLASINEMGTLLKDLGKYSDAEPYLREALEGYRRLLGDDDRNTLSSIGNMGLLLNAQGKPAQAEPYLRKALEGNRRVLGDEHSATLISIDNMGSVLQSQGRLADAKPYYLEALEGFRRVLGDDHPDTLTAIDNMGSLLNAQRKWAEAEPYYREALEGRRRVLGDEHPSTLTSINNMGDLLHYQGKLAEAERYYREALEESRRIRGDEHPNTLSSINNMAFLLRDQGRLAEAASLFAEATQAARTRLEDHPTTALLEHHYADVLLKGGRRDEALDFAQSAVDRYRAHPDWSPREAAHARSVLARALRAAGRLAEAEPHYREALAGNRRVLGDEDPETLRYNYALGFLLVDLDRPAEAEPYFREALEGRRRVLGDEHPDTLAAINELAFVLQAQGRLDEAEPHYRGALEINRRVQGDEHVDTQTAVHNMGFLLAAQGRLTEAETYYREALAIGRRIHGDEHPGWLSTLNNLGSVLKSQGRLTEAEPYYREVLERCRQILGDDHSNTLKTINGMGSLLQKQGNLAEAEAYFRESLETSRRTLGDEHPTTLTAMHMLGFVLQAQGKPDEAEPYSRAALETRRRVLGPEHHHTLISINRMGMLLRDLGRLSEAESLFADGTRAARAELGDHPTTGEMEHHYADVLREAGRVDEAIDLARTAVDQYRAHPDWPPDEAAHAREVLAEALLDVGDQAFLEQAEEAVRESLEIRRTVLPEDHPRVWLRYNAMSLLGDALVRQASEPSLAVEARLEKLREAEALLVESGGWLTQNGDRIPQQVRAERLRQALERVVKLYEVWNPVEPDAGHDARAAEWRAKLESLPGP